MKASQKTWMGAILLLSSTLFFSSCATTANFRIDQVQQFKKNDIKKIVVVPLVPIIEISENDFLEGEKTLSNFVTNFFTSKDCQIISIEQVRKELKILPTDSSSNIDKIENYYKADCLVICKFNKLVLSAGISRIANAYIEGNIIMQIADRNVETITDIVGFEHYETGFIFIPSLSSFLSYGFKELEPKLRAVYNQ
jgi:hypothetical protein